ncbi:transcriptional regulator with XRE-family HTH domain [Povalibacter uvarum]|uniref:Transcriptional regulator with XRE-family HTH domain n=1 Tax=Povalibacter uvarum TaxID=732238 RepID=A0A841HW05_9GAMM|nr:helix-turn-helix transcriptional regulator [Povalibacter uvarum]MBB6096132.1 transcriptional regulator with XRE-family HTH domain [Povalibacter uvarum]
MASNAPVIRPQQPEASANQGRSPAQSASAGPTFGSLLSRLRRNAGLTQMELAFAAGVSTRHTNFIERDRSNPSRAMVRRFCATLKVDAETRDRLMLAAGFAPERGEAPSMPKRTADLQDSFAMALAIRQQPSVASVLRMASTYLRELGLEDVLAPGYTMILTNVALLRSSGSAPRAEEQSEEAVARQLAQRIICDSVKEALQRLSAR